MEDIFTLDEQGTLIINKDYCRGIGEFKTILERDKGSEGDAQGRKKLKAFAELMYVKLVGDMFSYLNQGGYNEKEIDERARKASKLDSGWKPDYVILDAIKLYSGIQFDMLPALSAVINCKRGIKVSDVLVSKMITNMEKIMETHESRKTDPNAPPNIADELALITNLAGQLDGIVNISTKLPKMVDTLDALEERLATQQAGTKLGRGGKKVANRAEPKRN